MAYKYKTNTGSGSAGYIEFDITPDLPAGGAVATGDAVTITGVVHNTWGKATGLSIGLAGSTFGGTISIPFTSAKGSNKSFSYSFAMPDLSSYNGTARARDYQFVFVLPVTITSGGTTAHTTITLTDTNAKTITFLKYRLEPRIEDFRLERCNSAGAADNEGVYIRCGMLKLAKSSSASASDFSVCRFAWAGSDGSSGSFSSSGFVSAALTSSGYRDSGSASANIFGTRNFSTTVDYTVTLTVGDAYDTHSATVQVPRAFAILHLSGAANGGVAIGMFSSATDSKPKFEVAKSHESHFYGPVYFEGDVNGAGGSIAYSTSETNTGNTWIDGKAIYRRSWSGAATKTGNVTFDSSFTPSSMGTLVNVYGSFHYNGGAFYSLPMVHHNNVAYNVGIRINSDGLGLMIGSSVNTPSTWALTLEYTKA